MSNLMSQSLSAQSLSVLKCILTAALLSEQGEGNMETEAACLNSHRKPKEPTHIMPKVSRQKVTTLIWPSCLETFPRGSAWTGKNVTQLLLSAGGSCEALIYLAARVSTSPPYHSCWRGEWPARIKNREQVQQVPAEGIIGKGFC